MNAPPFSLADLERTEPYPARAFRPLGTFRAANNVLVADDAPQSLAHDVARDLASAVSIVSGTAATLLFLVYAFPF